MQSQATCAPTGADLADAFRGAMRRNAASAHLITTGMTSGEVAGMTATSVCSLSLTPPSLLVCLNRVTRTHSLLRAAQRFCVNIMQANDQALCEWFGRSSSLRARFASGDWSFEQGVPLLRTALANIVCTVDGQLDYSTHTAFVGRVETVALRGDEVPALLYHNGSYGKFSALAG